MSHFQQKIQSITENKTNRNIESLMQVFFSKVLYMTQIKDDSKLTSNSVTKKAEAYESTSACI